MFNKRKQPIKTAIDAKLDSLIAQYTEAKNRLVKAATEAIITREVITLYPEGADRNLANTTFKAKQRALLAQVAQVDIITTEIYNFCQKNGKHIKINNSHTIVENTYKDFYNKR